jgi:predicted TIM-barrel fold metal-dependent hydrolase
MASSPTKSAQIHSGLSHPVIDSDGHIKEGLPVFLEYLEAVAGPAMVDRYKAATGEDRIGGNSESAEEARERRITRTTWYTLPTGDMRDAAATALPRLLYERLDEMGLDVSVVYPTIGLGMNSIADDEVRIASCRAVNRLRADMFRGMTDRLLPAATIPMHTPAEAITELDYAVNQLGMKAAMMASYVKRPIMAIERKYPGAGNYAYWLDTYGIDSEHDYDPVWAKCAELKISPTFHSIGWGWGSRRSISSYIYNHLGGFAASAEAVCKGIFFGGIPARFPTLRFGFCEGGVAWARNLYCDLISHWEKRGREGLKRNFNPANIDREVLGQLWQRYGRKGLDGDMDSMVNTFLRTPSGVYPFIFDEFEKSGVKTLEDFRTLFIDRFYFGCEGDDPLNALAFKPEGTPNNVRINALYGSDISHWDVPHLAGVLEEVWELVEKGLATEADLRDFVFVNPIKFWTATNPEFFKGTVVEKEVDALLASDVHETSAERGLPTSHASRQ